MEKAEVVAGEAPGLYGIDHLTILVKELAKDTGALLRHVAQLRTQLHHLEKYMPDQFDALRQLIANGQQAAKDEAVQVNGKLDELNNLIQQLQATINNGQPVPQDVVDSMAELIEEVKTILPDSAPSPAPARRK